MFICICHAVTDSDIHRAVGEGARSFHELSFRTGCGTQCGTCVPQAREIMANALADSGSPGPVISLQVVSA